MAFTIPTPQRLQEAAERAWRSEIAAFAHPIVQHARSEEDVMVAAAVRDGQHVKLTRGRCADAGKSS